MILRNTLLAVGLCLTALGASADGLVEPSEKELAQIAEAASQVQALPAKAPRKLLVCSMVPTGYIHSAIRFGEEALKAMAKSTGAFEVVFAEDLDIFEAESLAKFDAIFFNSANNELFLPANFKELEGEARDQAAARDTRLKQALVDYIQSGKGAVMLHASLAIFREWEEYGNIIGGRFDNHPWHDKVTLRIEEPDYPLLKAFKPGGPEFQVTDEIYQVKGPYSRATHRVLLSLDLEKSPEPKVADLHREDKDYALAWVKPYGQGRIFYCGLGHDHDLFWNPVILQFLMDGTQFALGDLEADMTPSAPAANP